MSDLSTTSVPSLESRRSKHLLAQKGFCSIAEVAHRRFSPTMDITELREMSRVGKRRKRHNRAK